MNNKKCSQSVLDGVSCISFSVFAVKIGGSATVQVVDVAIKKEPQVGLFFYRLGFASGRDEGLNGRIGHQDSTEEFAVGSENNLCSVCQVGFA